MLPWQPLHVVRYILLHKGNIAHIYYMYIVYSMVGRSLVLVVDVYVCIGALRFVSGHYVTRYILYLGRSDKSCRDMPNICN